MINMLNKFGAPNIFFNLTIATYHLLFFCKNYMALLKSAMICRLRNTDKDQIFLLSQGSTLASVLSSQELDIILSKHQQSFVFLINSIFTKYYFTAKLDYSFKFLPISIFTALS